MQEPLSPRAPTPAPLTPVPHTPRSSSLAAMRSEMSNFQADMLQRFDNLMQMIADKKSQPSSRTIEVSDSDMEMVEAGPAPAQPVNTPVQPINQGKKRT